MYLTMLIFKLAKSRAGVCQLKINDMGKSLVLFSLILVIIRLQDNYDINHTHPSGQKNVYIIKMFSLLFILLVEPKQARCQPSLNTI